MFDRARVLTDGETPRLARRVLFAFALTFIASRILVFLVMTRKLPFLFLYVRGTHVHHLNYGIAILTGVAGYLLFARPRAAPLRRTALIYGIGLALTFDEFGMWLHLGGSYWQRASVDAVVVIAAVLGILGFAPKLEEIRPHHRWALALLCAAVLLFVAVLVVTGKEIGQVAGPKLRELEMSSTP